jgi:hypothetical protein
MNGQLIIASQKRRDSIGGSISPTILRKVYRKISF